jgi:exopolyphosphatase/guanosine-5'-triphosphate,3'-diphosphate pyrophosphatase
VDRAEVTRLGEGLDEYGEIQPEALERTAAAVEDMVEEARRNNALAIVAVATAGMRIAANRADVVEAIRERTGVTLHVISGETESRIAYLAVQAGLGLGDGSLVVFDTGGGSSQFTFGTGSHVDERFSVNVGAVRYTEQFGLDGVTSRAVLDEAIEAISTDLASLEGRPTPEAMVGMGGAITNITAVSLGLAVYDPDVVQGSILSRDEVDRQIEMYRSMDTANRRSIVGLQPKRAEVILAGACIVRTVMEALGQETLTVSDLGLRHGLAIERFGARFTP